jgi:23S rRNA U2552 (ribose-2'-O)-methylase RlmE/FtsJ
VRRPNVNLDHADISWTSKNKLALVIIVLFLSIQIGVPLARLWSPRPARFGWHMWSTVPPRLEIDLVMRDGSSQPANLRPYVAQARGELDLDNSLPPHLCRMLPEVAAVQLRSSGSFNTQIPTCP